MTVKDLVLEVNGNCVDETGRIEISLKIENGEMKTHLALVTPPVGEDYWLFRVKVSEDQAVVGFPKFSTIGVGFAKEEHDWNTNLPYVFETERIYNHIKCNKGDRKIKKAVVMEAIRMIQEAASASQN